MCFQDYYYYLSSNWLATEGMYIDMNSYQKLYNISKDSELPEIVFLDKGNSFSFTVFLSSHDTNTNSGPWAGPTWQPRGGAWSLSGWVPGFKPLPLPLTGSDLTQNLAVAVAVADPHCLEASVNQEVLINRKAVLYKVRRPARSTGAVPLILCTVSRKPKILLVLLSPSYRVFQRLWIRGRS